MASEQASKDLKIKRRTAKAKLTRLSNGLQHLLDDDRDLDEVTDMFKDLNVAYQELEDRHERYCETIVDDEVFMTEDAWLSECQTSFLDMQRKVKDYSKTKLKSDGSTEDSVVNNATPEVTTSKSVEVSSCKVQVERPKLPRFTGDVRDYMTFKSDFKHLIESRYSKRDAITILRSSLVGKPLDLIRGLGNDYDSAWSHLDNIYGDPRLVADAIVYDLGKFRPLKDGEDGRFCDLVHLIRRSYNSLQEVGRANDMDNNHMISLIERKLSSDDRKLWLRFIDRERTDASLHALLYWMELELKTRVRASAPLRDSRSSTIGHLAKNDGITERKPDFKCWLCKTSDHWVDQCKKVLSKSQEERFQLMKENRACFSCLKRAGKDHNLKTCKRRKRCNEKINTGEQCSSYHHPLLHRQIQTGSVDIASMTGTPALLPVLKVKMLGPNGNYEGNCLLDSGAQMSLVRNTVADELGLKGKPTVVNVTKVGDEMEEYNTMLYKVKVQGINRHQSYNVSAIGLDVINNSITSVSIEELGVIFNLRKDEIHRGDGPIDILIGTDHSKMHVGYTKIQGNLVARLSPLGWVIFGSTTENYSAGAVLHITVNNSVDLREFWTTEGMGVCHDPQRCQSNKMTKLEDEEFRVIGPSCEKMEKQCLDQYPRRKDLSQSRHILQNVNVRDEVSRCVSLDKLNDRQKEGLDFLRKTGTERPVEAKLEEKLHEVVRELRMERPVLTVQESKSQHRIDCQQFSNWMKLVRVTSYVLKFIGKLKLKSKRMVDEDVEVANSNLTPTDIQKGEDHLIKRAQESLKSRVDKGEMKTLSPYRDEAGIIRVGGRLDRAEMPLAMKHPALLPNEHWISTLIIRHIHKDGHTGVATTTAKARRKYWILKAHNLAKTVKFRCTTCRTFEHKLESQEMAELPKERLRPHSPPFHYSSCDYFGPLIVKIGRNKTTKHYGVLFTCLNTRAVHLEQATDCSTMEFIQVLRRFFAIRGQPAKMISDNGTQFVGAEHELKAMVKGWSDEDLKDFCADKGTEWIFTTPAAPHQNGCAEALVKSCKYALKKSIGEQILSPFELHTCLLEIANLVNQRPIGRIPTDPDDGSYLSPNDMLLGRASSDVAQGPFRETANPRHRVELVQRIVDSFWHRWTRDVLPLLTPRRKWNTDRRNIRVDDVVMMTDSNAVRGKWTIARVVQVYPGQDGKIRNVKVKTLNAEYRRPITKIALIYPAEGYED
ncbi:uncharacterized protein LOC121417521 [Lytechinus variegatus]|uniref:uncharacterized protein LOC121417521 n=1 Tax=Lytechinus variegatus TaxID=7654 RepID=UPI001BB1783D|nr:uncharacterized protein LOC121417521 [Lytechinus variegatus]